MESSDPKYKHKPSEKHTLEEVLKSLQDLIRVDLSEERGASGQTSAPEPDATQPESVIHRPPHSTAREKPAGAREDFAPVSPTSGPVNLDAVLRSLKDLIRSDLDVGDATKVKEERTGTRHEEYLAEADNIEEYTPEEVPVSEDELNLEDELPEDDAEPTFESETAPVRDEIGADIVPEEIEPIDEAPMLEEPELTSDSQTSAADDVIEEFEPLDEELTFDVPSEPASPAATSTVPELPGDTTEIWLDQPDTAAAPGTQHEMMFEEPAPAPSIKKAREPESAATSQSEKSSGAPVPEDSAGAPEEPLPVIEVVETFDESEYFPYESAEEGLSRATTQPPESAEEPTAPPDVAPETAEASTPAEEIIDLDKVIEPAEKPAADAHSVEFEVSELSPPPPEEPERTAPTDEPANASAPDQPPAEHSVDFEVSDLSPPLPEEPELSVPTNEPADTPAPELPPAEYSVEFDVSDLSPPLPEEPDLAAPAPDTPTETEATPAPPEPEIAATSEPETTAEEEQSKAVTEPAPEPPRETVLPAEAAADAPPSSGAIDDLPVLKDVVAKSSGAKRRKKAASDAPTLPGPDRAREIVVRAVAKLNVEMRKSGGTGLDTRTILRLQQLIREELEKGGQK